jgi:predicted amidohydrolase
MPRFWAACIQTDLPNPASRAELPKRIGHALTLIEQAVVGYRPFGDVRLVVFPEFYHSAPIYPDAAQLREHLAVEISPQLLEPYVKKAREHSVYIQTGTFLEVHPRWHGHVFNTTCLIGPEGELYRYRKVNPWLPWEVHTSPHDLLDQGYDDPLFPVVETEIGKLGCAICYDWLFPEAIRQLAVHGAEILIRVSAYMDPWGATQPMDWWTVVNRCRALENIAYVVAANQGASLSHYPPFSWPGGSMVVDFDGRILAQADPGPGDKIVVAPVDIDALRHERSRRQGHQMLEHMRLTACPPKRWVDGKNPWEGRKHQ